MLNKCLTYLSVDKNDNYYFNILALNSIFFITNNSARIRLK